MLGNNQEKEIAFQPPSSKGTLVGVLLLVVAVAAYVFFARPISADLDVLEANLTTKTVELDKLKTEIAELNKAEDALDLTSEVQKTESLKEVPDKMYQDQVIRDLIEIAENYEIALRSISFSKGSGPNDKIGSLRISASFEGNYLDLTDFLEGLEQNDRIFKVESINVQLSQLSLSDLERVSFSLNIQTYFQN